MGKLILGTAQFGLDYGVNNSTGIPTIDKLTEILDFAFENKIRFLDTAEAYGNAQERIGKYHSASSNVFKIITKFSPLRIDLPENISERIAYNLKVLQVKTIYSYMFHNFNDFKQYFNIFKEELLLLKSKGIIQKIGVSLHSNEEIEELLNCKEIELIQLPFNLLDNENQRSKILKIAKIKKIEIHTRSVFLQGLFFKNQNQLTGNLKCFTDNLKELNDIVKKEGMNNVALNYVYSKKYIDHLLLGVDTVEQLISNINCLNNNISMEIYDKIDRIQVKKIDMLNPVNWEK